MHLLVSFLMILQISLADSFAMAKATLIQFLQDNPHYQRDFYCNAPFKWVKNGFKVIPSSFYTPRNQYTKEGKINLRARQIELEHIMPAHTFGKNLSCWKKGGRKECAKDPLFKQMEGDLQNIVPAIGEINADRGNLSFRESPKKWLFNQYGQCKVYANFKDKEFYPANYSKGWIARSYLYMQKTYKIRLSKKERQLMEAWDRMYPMSKKERDFRNFSRM
ncbi:MAG: endonuclease [Helicobacter sp.]|nr:endonuclease [Helicobacter sp.]